MSLYERIKRRCYDNNCLYIDISEKGVHKSSYASDLISKSIHISNVLNTTFPKRNIFIWLDDCHSFIPIFWACLSSAMPVMPIALISSKANKRLQERKRIFKLLSQLNAVVIVNDFTLAQNKSIESLPNIDCIQLDSLMSTKALQASDHIKENELAFVLQTSGTTGNAKFACFTVVARLLTPHSYRQLPGL